MKKKFENQWQFTEREKNTDRKTQNEKSNAVHSNCMLTQYVLAFQNKHFISPRERKKRTF